MVAIRPLVDEAVEQIYYVGVILGQFLVGVVLLQGLLPLRAHHPLMHHLEDFNLVVAGVKIVRRRLLDLEGNVVFVFEVLGEPNGGEVPPTQFLDDHIAVEDNFADMHWVVSTSLASVPSDLVVLDAFVLLVEVVLLFLVVLFDLVGGEFEVVVGRGRGDDPFELLGLLLLLLGLLVALLIHEIIIHTRSVNIVLTLHVLVRTFAFPLLHLYRCVVDLVASAQGRQPVQHLLLHAPVRENVGGKEDLRGPQLPDVEIMDLFDPLHRAELLPQLLAVDLLRGRFQDDVVALFRDWPSGNNNQHRKDVGGDWVEVVPWIELSHWCPIIRTDEINDESGD
jgi:hypothetical protein